MRHHILIPTILIIATITVYWPVYSYDFVDRDDAINIYENPNLNPPILYNILQFWKKPKNNLYIPLTYTVWAISALFARYLIGEGKNSILYQSVFHIVNLILHIISVLIVFVILRTLIRVRYYREQIGHKEYSNPQSETRNSYLHDRAAGFGALLFALHPMQVEPVSWATGTKDLLCGLLSFVAVWRYIIYATYDFRICNTENVIKKSLIRKIYLTYRNPNYIFASIAFILAMLSKPTAVVLPLIVWILDRFLSGISAKERNVAILSWVIAAIPFIVLTKIVQLNKDIIFITPLWLRPLVAGDALFFYIYKLIFPIWLGPDYGRSPMFVLRHGWVYLTCLVPCLLAIIIWFQKNHWKWIAPLGIFIAGVLPVLGFIPFTFQNISTVADRYLYISMLGPALGLALFFSDHRRAVITVIGVLILILLAICSLFQTLYWQNTIKLFEHSLKVNPKSYIAHYNLGTVLDEQDKLHEAGVHYSKALHIKPDLAEIHNNFGVVLSRQGALNEAIVHFTKALQINPYDVKAYQNLKLALHQIGKSIKDWKMDYIQHQQ